MEFFELDHAYRSRCQASDVTRVHYPYDGVRVDRCGGSVTHGVTWEGMVEGTHTQLVCDRHALRMAEQAIGGAYANR